MNLVSFALVPILLLADLSNGSKVDDPSPVLWENLRFGMPKSEVKALYPKYRATILHDCPVHILSTYTASRLRAVILVNTVKSPPYADRVRQDLESRHGAATRVEGFDQPRMLTITRKATVYDSIHREDTIWDVANVRIILSTFPGTHQGYNVVYSLAPDSAAHPGR